MSADGGKTRAEVAETLGLSRQRIAQIEQEALAKLRKAFKLSDPQLFDE